MTASPALPVVVRSSCETGGHKLWSDKSVQVDERGQFLGERVVVIFQVLQLVKEREWTLKSGKWRVGRVVM